MNCLLINIKLFFFRNILYYRRDHAVSILVSLADRQNLSSTTTVTSDVSIKRSLPRWQQQTTDLISRFLPLAKESLTMSKIAVAMMPHLLVEWLSCHALLLAHTISIWDATAHLQRHIELIPHNPGTL